MRLVFLQTIGFLLILLLLILPLVNLKIFIASPIFPALEIILVYYLVNYCHLRELKILVIGLIIDELYFMPMGCNSLVFLVGNVFLKYVGKWFLIQEYVTNLITFAGYLLIILVLRYLVFISQSQHPSLLILLLQCLTTIFAYPVIRVILDKTLMSFRVKNVNQ